MDEVFLTVLPRGALVEATQVGLLQRAVLRDIVDRRACLRADFNEGSAE
jgi:hypothetical protein